MSTNTVGVIGLSVMGASLAQNLAGRGERVAAYNRSYEKTEKLLKKGVKNIHGYEQLTEFVESLESPRKILVLVKSGAPVDAVIAELLPLLEKEDILVDCGNSNWHDTERRQQELEGQVHFVGCGVSGGEEGALRGPSLMPGGDAEVLEAHLLPILKKIAAKDFQGKPCVTNVGRGAAGHFVKMVHNGIEYAMMQGIAEVYDILRSQGYSNLEMQEAFRGWNYGNLQSFLMDITVDILGTRDKLGQGYLLDRVSDEAKAKGTGGWTVEAGMAFGVAVPSIAAAVIARAQSARNMSFLKGLQLGQENGATQKSKEELKTPLYRALELVFLTSYLQGLDLIYQANREQKWNIDLSEVIRIWQGGCIIRSQMLSTLGLFWATDKSWKQKLFQEVRADMDNLRLVLYKAGTPKPVLHTTYDYLQGMFRAKLSSNLIQAQRDYFGAHGYQRTDKNGNFTGTWG